MQDDDIYGWAQDELLGTKVNRLKRKIGKEILIEEKPLNSITKFILSFTWTKRQRSRAGMGPQRPKRNNRQVPQIGST